MMREQLLRKGIGVSTSFRWRGGEITRFEGLSDAVFAFAVTLLIVSLEVPKTFNELLGAMRGFAAFAICFTLLMTVWYKQYIFFRRYSLQDDYTIFLNSVLLFVVLFYIYPLKFVFTLMVNLWMGIHPVVHLPNGQTEPVIESHQAPMLMIIFGAGFVAVSLVFALLFYHAYRRRDELELNELEVFDTWESIFDSLINIGVGVASMLIAFLASPKYKGFAGLVYPLLLTPGLTIFHTVMGRRRRRIEERFALIGQAERGQVGQ
jgi:uncharacterized membrane protein